MSYGGTVGRADAERKAAPVSWSLPCGQCSRAWQGGSAFHLRRCVYAPLRELKTQVVRLVVLERCSCIRDLLCGGILYPKNTGACLGFAADPLLRGCINIQGVFLYFFCLFLKAFSSARALTIAANYWLLVKL